ncbi:hypothetical protein ACVW0J_003280 [Bradyrhizobium sp. i1.7.7]
MLDEGQRLHRREQFCGMHGFTIMAHAPGLLGQISGLLGITRAHHRPAVDEDLRTDLLGYGRAVQRDRAALRRRDTGLQPQIGGVLGGIADATPP